MSYRAGSVLLAAVAFTLGACGNTADSGSPTAQSGSNATTAAAVSAVDATKLCDFLRSEIPVLSAVGSEVGRLAQLTGHLYTWGEQQKVVGKMDVEKLTKASCPDVRADVLKLLGEDSFSNVF